MSYGTRTNKVVSCNIQPQQAKENMNVNLEREFSLPKSIMFVYRNMTQRGLRSYQKQYGSVTNLISNAHDKF